MPDTYPETTINGVTVNHSWTGAVDILVTSHIYTTGVWFRAPNACEHYARLPNTMGGFPSFVENNSPTVWIGKGGAFAYTLFFSKPVDRVRIKGAGVGPRVETFKFATNGGTVILKDPTPSVLLNGYQKLFSVSGDTVTARHD